MHLKSNPKIRMYLAQTYNKLFSLLSTDVKFVEEDDLLSSMMNIREITNSKDCHIREIPNNLLCFNAVSNSESANCVSKILDTLKCECAGYRNIGMPLSYMLDELICNIQQHSMARLGVLSVCIDNYKNFMDICIADDGIGIFGSYVNHQKYLNLLGNGDADAICLAREGYSTKNLPETENRGYGISSNAKWIVNGLGGEFSIISGKALYIENVSTSQIFSLPENVEWAGTMIAVRIPMNVPETFNIYDYIS